MTVAWSFLKWTFLDLVHIGRERTWRTCCRCGSLCSCSDMQPFGGEPSVKVCRIKGSSAVNLCEDFSGFLAATDTLYCCKASVLTRWHPATTTRGTRQSRGEGHVLRRRYGAAVDGTRHPSHCAGAALQRKQCEQASKLQLGSSPLDMVKKPDQH